jgi:hypothetical protein
MADAKITYKSGVIAEINGGQTATLKCKGKKMDDDVTVESLGGGTDERFKQLVEGTLTEIDDSEITEIRAYSFYKMPNLLKVHGANVKKIGELAFSSNTGIPKINDISFPNCTQIMTSAFETCRELRKALFPSLKSLNSSAFKNCYAMEMVDLGNVSTIQYGTFSSNYSLKVVILRNTEQMTTLSVTNAFTNCYHFYGTVNSTYNPEGLKDGYFYVPRKWLSDEDETMDYRRATNWTTFATQFRALEDYTVDGTTTGELDWEKVNA